MNMDEQKLTYEQFKEDILQWKNTHREEYNRFSRLMTNGDERQYLAICKAIFRQLPGIRREWELSWNDDSTDVLANINLQFAENAVPGQIVELYRKQREENNPLPDNVPPVTFWGRIKSFFSGKSSKPGVTLSAPLVLSWLYYGKSFEAMVSMVKLDLPLTLVSVAILPFVAGIAIRLEKELDRVYDAISEENAVMNTVAQENLAGVRTVKSFAREPYEIKKFRKHNQKYCDLNMDQARVLMKYDPAISFLTKLMRVLVLLAGGYGVIHGRITLGVLTAFMEYTSKITWPIENVGWLGNCFASAIASNKKLNKILAEEPQIAEPENPVELSKLPGDLEFHHVDFSLHDTPILQDIDFTLKQGHTLGIMGMTGSGKTTIVNLLERFYDVTDGSICLDGHDIRTLPLRTVRDTSSVVMQDVFLFSDTISENVRLGSRSTMKSEEVHNAVSAACASEFVDHLSDQYETVIGERGMGLSGGQKQRLSIARALAKQAPILVLDDSTSALDMETEYEIQSHLAEKKDVSKIIIAHRISSVQNADEILYLDHGRIAERGTHESLMAQKGLYYSTWEAQYGDYHKAKAALEQALPANA